MAPHDILQKLVLDLKSSLEALKEEPTWSQLQDALHHDERLPDKNTLMQSSEAVDLLHQIGQLLEPAHLVLADHFLGTDLCFVPAVQFIHADRSARIHKYQMSLRGGGAQNCRPPCERLKVLDRLGCGK